MESIFKSDYPKDHREQFKDLLEERGIKQNWVAKKLDLSPVTVHAILHEKIKLTEENRKALNELLGTDI